MGLILHFEAGLGFCSLTVTMQHGAKRLKDEESHLSFSLSKTKNFSMTNSAWNQIIARHFCSTGLVKTEAGIQVKKMIYSLVFLFRGIAINCPRSLLIVYFYPIL